MDISDQLQNAGYHVHEAKNADEAIEILAVNEDIQVIFTDIDMPGSLDGLKLAWAVRDLWPPIKIIVTSGNHMVEASQMPSGSRFFPKPYMSASVAAAMQEMVC